MKDRSIGLLLPMLALAYCAVLSATSRKPSLSIDSPSQIVQAYPDRNAVQARIGTPYSRWPDTWDILLRNAHIRAEFQGTRTIGLIRLR